MKKYILVLFLIITAANFSYGQGPGAPPGYTSCADCEEGYSNGDIPTSEGYENCLAYFNCNTVPIDSNILVLFSLAISFGAYSVYKNKKKLLKN